MNGYIRGTAQFENAHMVGRSAAWRDGYLSAFYGKGDETCKDKSREYVTEFYKGFQHISQIMHMNYRTNLEQYRQNKS